MFLTVYPFAPSKAGEPNATVAVQQRPNPVECDTYFRRDARPPNYNNRQRAVFDSESRKAIVPRLGESSDYNEKTEAIVASVLTRCFE